MPIRTVKIPALGRTLSNIMAAPSSGAPATHEDGLDAYYRLGGNCIHLHGEGGETHSRRATGDWLRTRQLRSEFFLCTQICHEGWDDNQGRPIDRFTPEAVTEDVATDIELLGTDYLDLVYFDDRPSAAMAPMIEAIGREIASGRIRTWGIRNWTADRIRESESQAALVGAPPIAALFTTELALPIASAPLWPEYVPFDDAMDQVVREMSLAVFAHASDATLGQCLFGDEEAGAPMRPEWVRRWDRLANAGLVACVQAIAAARGVTLREINLAWTLCRPSPVIGVVGLPSLLSDIGAQYDRASQLQLEELELRALNDARTGD